MDDSNIDRIKNNISNNFSKIDTNTFISKLKNSSSVSECISLSNEFIESYNEIKSDIITFISDELNNLKQSFEEKEVSNNIFHNEILVLFNNVKNIISQNKLKIKNISSNINDIYTGINLINSNIEKKKYSLASSRISKIINIKNNLLSNIKQLETNQQKILEEFGNEKNNKFNNNSNNSNKIRPAPTPFPVTSYFNLEKNYNKKKINTLSNSNLNNNTESSNKKMVNKRRRDFSFSMRENTLSNLRNTSVNNTPLKAYNTINNFFKKTNENKKEEELNKKLISQTKLNDKLKKEIIALKEQLNKSSIITIQPLDNNSRMFNNQYIFNFKEKINAISDIIFSLTFSFNDLQNKNKNKSNEKIFSDIKKNLLDITTQISELKSILYQISLSDNEDTINNSSEIIKSTNQSINFTEEFYSINDNNINKESADNNITEISKLKEKLRTNEKKLVELKNMYDSDIESRNLIENLLKKNLEENKVTYESKINKYKKKLEEKEKELEEIRKKIEKEEMDILNKIKKDNEENIQKLKNIYELKLNTNKKIFSDDLKEEKSINLIIINSLMNNDSLSEREDLEKKLDIIEKEKKELEISIEKEKMEFRENNNKSLNQILELKNEILGYKNKENELNEEINIVKINNEKKLKKLEQEIKEKIDRITQEKNEEINKIKNEKDEINNKLNKKDKEIITLITNSTKEKKNLIEQSNNEMEQLKKEINDLKDINEVYKDQVNSLQKKFFEIENINNNKIKNISIKKEIELNYIFINPKEEINPNKNFIEKTEISLNILSPINPNFPRKKSKNISINNNSIEDELNDNEEESDDFYDYENEENEEFIKKMKKINKKNKLDNEEMKKYRKENRKMLSKLEDTLDEVDELKEKMLKIEKIVSEKQGQLFNSLKKYFSRILTDFNFGFNMNNENSENFIYFMKLLQFSDEEIKNIISNINSQNANNNSKKKIQFNIFK